MGNLLKAFYDLPASYVVCDTETTGFADKDGQAGLVTVGLASVVDGEIVRSHEFKMRPYRSINPFATKVHGISNEEAAGFPEIETVWPEIQQWLSASEVVVMHNAGFDWPILEWHAEHFGLAPIGHIPTFCSMATAREFSDRYDLSASKRGPSLDRLAKHLGVETLRTEGLHGAEIDARMTAMVVEALRALAAEHEDAF